MSGIDPFGFALEVLGARGALLERDGDSALALLPKVLADELGVSEECRLSVSSGAAGGTGTHPVGFGSLLLDRLLSLSRARDVWCCARAELGAARPQQVRTWAEKLSARNAVSDLLDVTQGESTYACAFVAYTAHADDRQDGLVIAAAAPDGAEPDDVVRHLLDPSAAASSLFEIKTRLELAHDAARVIAARAERAIRSEVAPFLESVQSRHRRDHERTRDYFGELIREARAPRRRVDAPSIAAKVEHLEREREAKLSDLRTRFATTISSSVAALILAAVPEAVARIRIRRRKDEREIRLRLPATARSPSRLACEGCLGVTLRPAFCDDALHLLCEACAPNAQGRFACPACEAGRR